MEIVLEGKLPGGICPRENVQGENEHVYSPDGRKTDRTDYIHYNTQK